MQTRCRPCTRRSSVGKRTSRFWEISRNYSRPSTSTPPTPVPHAPAASNAATSPRAWIPLSTRSKVSGGGGPPNGPGGGTGTGVGDHSNSSNNSSSGGGGAAGSNGSGGGAPAGGAPPPGGGNPRGNAGGSPPPGQTPPQQSGGAGCPGGTPPSQPPGLPPSGRHSDPWAPLDRSRKALPKLSLPSNYKSCSILDMQQILESWYDKSTFAIATWRGDAQR